MAFVRAEGWDKQIKVILPLYFAHLFGPFSEQLQIWPCVNVFYLNDLKSVFDYNLNQLILFDYGHFSSFFMSGLDYFSILVFIFYLQKNQGEEVPWKASGKGEYIGSKNEHVWWPLLTLSLCWKKWRVLRNAALFACKMPLNEVAELIILSGFFFICQEFNIFPIWGLLQCVLNGSF